MHAYKTALPEIELKYKTGDTRKIKITKSSDIDYLCHEIYNSDTLELFEQVIVIYLNPVNTTIGWIKHSSGGMCQSTIDIPLILSAALKCGAKSIILSHNHPSGQKYPSPQDKDITKRLYKACNIIGFNLLDHIIVTPDDGYYSFADEGELY